MLRSLRSWTATPAARAHGVQWRRGAIVDNGAVWLGTRLWKASKGALKER